MKKNLTLKIEEHVIYNAKRFAEENELDLSELVENILKLVEHKDYETKVMSARVKRLKGVIKEPNTGNKKNAKERAKQNIK